MVLLTLSSIKYGNVDISFVFFTAVFISAWNNLLWALDLGLYELSLIHI